MSERFVNPAWRWSAAGIATLAAVWFCYAGARHAFAAHYGGSSIPEDWERAAQIEPNDAEIWHQLGRFHQLDFDHADLPLAISEYRRAVKLDPRSPYDQLDLASALEMSGNNEDAERYFRGAQASYPISAEVSWKYGNFLLRRERLPEAYVEIHRAVTVDAKLLPLAISRVWHSNPDVHLLLDQVLPHTPEAYGEALAFLSDEQDATAALAIWNRLIAEDPHIEWKWVYVLTDMLIAKERFDEAGTVWRQALVKDQATTTASNDGSLVYDGGFEKDISGGGFGWRQRNVPGADFDFDTDQKHSGARSARLIFDGTKNLSYEDLYQNVLVSPSTRYRFRGYLQTDQITTNSGVNFEIFDPKDPSRTVATPNETGTLPWTLGETEFTTGPQTYLVVIRLVRKPSERLDNKISGTAWIDDVSLVPAGLQR